MHLINKGICKFEQGEPARFLILDNKIYSYGENKNYVRTVGYKNYI